MTKGDSQTEPTCNFFVRTLLKYISQEYFIPSNSRLGITQTGSDPALYLNNLMKRRYGIDRSKSTSNSQNADRAKYLFDEEENNKFFMAHGINRQRNNRDYEDHGGDTGKCEGSLNIGRGGPDVQILKENIANARSEGKRADNTELSFQGHECRFLDNKLQTGAGPKADGKFKEMFTRHRYIYTEFDDEKNEYDSQTLTLNNCENDGTISLREAFNNYVVHADEGDEEGDGEEEEHHIVHAGHHTDVHEESEEGEEGEEDGEEHESAQHGDHVDHKDHHGGHGGEGEEEDEDEHYGLHHHGVKDVDEWEVADHDEFFDEDDAGDDAADMPEISEIAEEVLTHASSDLQIAHRFTHYHHGEFGRKDGLPGTAPFDTRFPNSNQTKHCFFMFVDYHRCAAKLGDDVYRCHYFRHVYETICPNEWIQKWQDQMDAGTFPFKIQ